ncbi:MAG TPA: hypothetical protein VEE83_03175 [Thermoplasmata archaeon]|nr:hypothetical protein [Thermoplasmata archaeon]
MADRAHRPRRKSARREVSPRRRTRRPRPPAARASRIDHVRFEIDLVRERFRRSDPTFVQRLEGIFGEREVVEVEGLLRLSASVLTALSRRGFSRVDHWEVQPGGWLPLPEPVHERLREPVGHLLHALRSEAWKRVAGARSFAVRLSGSGEMRADVIVRRVHRERRHAVTVELFGSISTAELRAIERALRDELVIARLRRVVDGRSW